MERHEPSEQELFEDIIAHNDMANDAGVVSFGEELKEYEEYLRDHYIKAGRAEIPRDELEEMEQRFRASWPFFEKIATLSGRLEIASGDETETLAALLGDIAIADDEGELVHEDEAAGVRFCIVDGARLESSRIIIDPIRDDDGILRDVRVSYEFKIPLDDDEDILFYAQPGDLHHHVYEGEISSVEARMRLLYKWPEEFAILDELVLSDKDPLPVRLTALTDQLRDQLADDEFRKYAELYVNDELALNRERPYTLTILHELDVLGDIEAEDSTWMPLQINDGSLQVDLYRPDIRFTRASTDDPTAIEACVYGETYNDADGDDKPELVTVPAENIFSFRSTWAKDSLASLALSTIQHEMVRAMDDTETPATVMYAPVEADDDSQQELGYIDQLELIEQTLEQIQREVKAAEEIMYVSREAAEEQAGKLAKTLTEMLNGTIARSGVEVELMGDVLRTNWREGDSEGDDHTRPQVWYGFDPENPVRWLHSGESIKGVIDSDRPVRPFIKEQEDERGNAVYWPAPRLAVQLLARTNGENYLGGMLFSQLLAQEWAAAALGREAADIKLVELEQARESRAALEEASGLYGEDSPLMKRILALESAIGQEDKNDFTPLQPDWLAEFPKDLVSHVANEEPAVREKTAAPALKALESMFYGKRVISKSEVHTRTADGFVTDEERTGLDAAWVVLDFKLSEDGREIMMFVGSVKQPDVNRYIPLSSITDFAF